MSSSAYRWVQLMSVLLGCIWATPAWAIPVFARKYGFNCSMCHSSVPRLNDFGTRYRQNGYRLPERESDEKTVLETPAPFAARTSAGFDFVDASSPSGETDLAHFRLNGLDLLSGGLFSRSFGYILVYTPPLSLLRGVAEQEGTLELASVVVPHVAGSGLSLRFGRIEPAYVVFSVKRRLSVSDYEIYDVTFPGGPPLSDTEEGLELTYEHKGFELAGGWLNGSSTNRPKDVPANGYLRFAYVFGRGEGQMFGQRLGLTAQVGDARPQAGEPVRSRQPYFRVGADASLNGGGFNLAVQMLWGHDDGDLWTTTEAVNWGGGFAELSYLLREELVAYARYGVVFFPDAQAPDVTRVTAGVRYYMVENLALQLEYGHRSQDSAAPWGGERLVDFATARLDFVF